MSPSGRHFGTFIRRLWDVSPKTKNYKIADSLVFQAHILWNKIENDAMKMHLYERFKIDVLRMSQGRHPTNAFSGSFEDVRRTFLQNCKNKQQLTFKYFAQHIFWVE